MNRHRNEIDRFRAKLDMQALEHRVKALRASVARANACDIYDERRRTREAQAKRESLDDGAYGLMRAKRRSSR